MTAPRQTPDAADLALARLRRRSLVVGMVLVVEAAALWVVVGVLAGAGRVALLPVALVLPAGGSGEGAAGDAAGGAGEVTRVVLAQIDLGAAVVVLCLVAAGGRFVWVVPAVAAWAARASASGRRTVRWIEFSLTASITVFLVAALNGVSDVAGLVPIYALTSAMVLFAVLQERAMGWRGHPKLALCFGAAVGIVPWGVIAFYQVAAGVAGEPPAVGVRVVTLVMLAFALAFAVTQWRENPAGALPAGALPAGGEWMHATLALASTSVFAWIVVLGVILPRT